MYTQKRGRVDTHTDQRTCLFICSCTICCGNDVIIFTRYNHYLRITDDVSICFTDNSSTIEPILISHSPPPSLSVCVFV